MLVAVWTESIVNTGKRLPYIRERLRWLGNQTVCIAGIDQSCNLTPWAGRRTLIFLAVIHAHYVSHSHTVDGCRCVAARTSALEKRIFFIVPF